MICECGNLLGQDNILNHIVESWQKNIVVFGYLESIFCMLVASFVVAVFVQCVKLCTGLFCRCTIFIIRC